MLEIVVILVIIALVLLFLRAGRQNTIVYRKKVASPERGYSIRDHPDAFGQSATPDYYADNTPPPAHAFQETLAFGGGEFGGSGAGDSCDVGPTDSGGNDFNNFDVVGTDFSDTSSGDSACDDSGPSDSGSSDSCSDSSSDYTSFSSD